MFIKFIHLFVHTENFLLFLIYDQRKKKWVDEIFEFFVIRKQNILF